MDCWVKPLFTRFPKPLNQVEMNIEKVFRKQFKTKALRWLVLEFIENGCSGFHTDKRGVTFVWCIQFCPSILFYSNRNTHMHSNSRAHARVITYLLFYCLVNICSFIFNPLIQHHFILENTSHSKRNRELKVSSWKPWRNREKDR